MPRKRRKAEKGILRTSIPFTRTEKHDPMAGMTQGEIWKWQEREKAMNTEPDRPKGLRVRL